MRAQRLSELEVAAVAAESLQSQLLAAGHNAADTDIQIVIGREGSLAARREICGAAKKEICAFDKPPYVQPRPNATTDDLDKLSPEWQALERGVKVRAVYHPGFDTDRLAELALFAEKGEQSRTAPVPMKLILVDSQVALIPSMRSYSPGQELRASVTRHPMLVEALVWLFETVWDSSVPIITTPQPSEQDPRRQMLISLLMKGFTDSAIANQLGINVRSVTALDRGADGRAGRDHPTAAGRGTGPGGRAARAASPIRAEPPPRPERLSRPSRRSPAQGSSRPAGRG